MRPVRDADHGFVLGLYLDGARPLLEALGLWDEKRMIERFARSYKPAQACIVLVEGQEIGWLQESLTERGYHLHQLHLLPAWRNRGIGTGLLRDLLERGRRSGHAVALNVLRGNRAIALYKRLGFRVVGGDEEKLFMRRESATARKS